ncbi:tetratricopeptide repeat protein [Saccharothrix syringae]|uniref:tetratricopeptide repeat protein n=1 Tax=Saccharothrix syringae TaxID=103733 RepID=UPI00068D6F08|nr:hypothetical protein [Saccharothrix syringae]
MWRAAAEAAEHLPDPSARALAHRFLGRAHAELGRCGQAVEHYRQAVVLLRALGNTTNAADALDRLGHSPAALGQHAQARAAWEEAFNLYRQQGRDTDAERVRRQLDAPPR